MRVLRTSSGSAVLCGPGAFDAFYRAHAEAVLRFFVRRTYDPHLALDLTAETFAVALSRRRRFRGSTPEEAAGWLFAIARNEHLQFVRRDGVEGRAMRRLALTTPVLSDGDLARVLELADLDAVAGDVRAGLEALPAVQREAVWLRVVDELPYREIAARLQISEQNARARVSRGLMTLQRDVPRPEGSPPVTTTPDRLPIDALEELALQLRARSDGAGPGRGPRAERPRADASRRRAIAALAPVAATAAVVALVVLPGGAGPADALARARSAIDPAGTILHYSYTTDTTFRAPGQRLPRTGATVWPTAGRWRFRNPRHLVNRRSTGAQESSFGGGVMTVYTEGAHSRRVTVGITDPRAAIAPDFFGSQDLRAVLARGAVRDLGVHLRDGRRVRRLLSVERRGQVRVITNRIVYDVDPESFAPRHIHIVSTFRGRHSSGESTDDIRVVAFERLPRTAANLRLLTIPIPPGTALTRYRAFTGRYGTRTLCARPRRSGLPLCPE